MGIKKEFLVYNGGRGYSDNSPVLIQREVCEVFAGFGEMRKTKTVVVQSHAPISV